MQFIKSKKIILFLVFCALCALLLNTQNIPPSVTRKFGLNQDFFQIDSLEMELDDIKQKVNLYRNEQGELLVGPISGLHHCRTLLIKDTRIFWFDDSEGKATFLANKRIFTRKRQKTETPPEITEPMYNWAEKYSCKKEKDGILVEIFSSSPSRIIRFTIPFVQTRQ